MYVRLCSPTNQNLSARVECRALSISGGVRVRTLVAVIQSAVWKTSDSCVCATDAAQTCVLTHQGRVSPQGTVFNLCRVIITNKLGHSSRPIPIYRRAARLDWSHYRTNYYMPNRTIYAKTLQTCGNSLAMLKHCRVINPCHGKFILQTGWKHNIRSAYLPQPQSVYPGGFVEN